MAEIEENEGGYREINHRWQDQHGNPEPRDKTHAELRRLALAIATLRRERDEARAALAKEREDCAKVAEKQLAPWVKEKIGDYWEGYRDAIEDAVEDIRARTGETR